MIKNLNYIKKKKQDKKLQLLTFYCKTESKPKNKLIFGIFSKDRKTRIHFQK